VKTVFVIGLPGCGKSYFAKRLAETIHAEYISSDLVRQQVISKKSYTEEEKLFVYDAMLARMKNALKQRKSVVLDATFYRNDIREKFISEAEPNENIFIEVIADDAIVSERLQRKRTDSDADIAVYKKVKQQWEPLHQQHLVLQSTNDNINEMLTKASEYLNVNNDIRANKQTAITFKKK
jgi:predicted kinase